MTPRLFIAVACHNRKAVAEQCLPTLRDSALHADDRIVLFNDGSTQFHPDWLDQFKRPGDYAMHALENVGIQKQRRVHLDLFLRSDFTHLYLTDHDMLHDPQWREIGLALQSQIHDAPALCLYNTAAHADLPNNTILDSPSLPTIWRHYAPGCSYLLRRAHVERLQPFIAKMDHFDWQIPAILGHRFATSRTSYCDHIGWGGERHPKGAGLDEGDRALNPTPWLVKKRAEVVAALKAQMQTAISTP